jgi:ribosomal protein S27E
MIGAAGTLQLKCPGCGAPIVPKVDEAVITCEFCGGSIALGDSGWQNVKNHTMLSIKLYDKEKILVQAGAEMDKGLFHKHLQEQSKLEEAILTVVPYWIVPVSARTKVTFLWSETQSSTFVSNPQAGGRWVNTGSGQVITKTEEVDENYDFPVVAVKALVEYQPKDFKFALTERTIFDSSKIPKSLRVMNGDVSEEAAKAQAKTLVSQLQYEKAHEAHKYHTIMQIDTQIEVSGGELLHAPIWHISYDHEGKKIVLVVDANSGGLMSSSGV